MGREATGFEFKHDYTVIDSPRAVTFRDKYGVQMIMRFNEIHKFSDGTLQQIDEALDYRVKEFQINRSNPGMNTRFWFEVRSCGQEQGLYIRYPERLRHDKSRIFRESGELCGCGRIREGDYRNLGPYGSGAIMEMETPRSRESIHHPMLSLNDSKEASRGSGYRIMLSVVDSVIPKEMTYFNLFSVSQMCDKKNSVLFTKSECLIVSPSFQLLDESQVVLRAHRKDDVYNLDLKNIIPSRGLEKQLNHNVKIIRCDNGTEFKNHAMNEFCAKKGIKREFSVARTPQQNGVTERKNRTLIEAARTMLADSLLPIPFWAEAVNTACYVLNRIPWANLMENLMKVICLDTLPLVKPLEYTTKGPKGKSESAHNFLEDQPLIWRNWSQDSYIAGSSGKDKGPTQEYILLPLQPHRTRILVKDVVQIAQEKPSENASSDKDVQDSKDATDKGANADGISFMLLYFPNDGIFNGAYDDDDDVGCKGDFNNMEKPPSCSPIPPSSLRIHKDHPKGQILGDPTSAVQTRGKIQKASSVQQALTISQALQDEIWVEAIQEELLQFNLQKVWVLVDFPYGKKVIGTKWVFRNKRDERSIVVKNKARLVAQGFRQDAFLYGTIEEEVYVHQPPGFVDPAHPNKVYKVIKALYGLHQAPRAWYETLSSFLMENGFRRGELTFFLGLQVKQQPNGIFISQDKFVADILKKFDFLSIRTATTPIESNKPLVKDEDGVDVYVHVNRSMIGSLVYLTASRPDIMFAVCACARFQVTLKASHLNAVKRIFRYLKHQPKLGLWYPRDSPFELEAYSDSDYGGASLDRKSTTGGCQFLGRRLISWQCKKQTIMANSTTEAEYVAAANCCGQVLWIQNQMMDYGFNFMNTKIHIDNESTISVIKNPVAHSRTKHIEIRFHFIRDCYEKRLIEVIKIHTDSNVVDLLTKGFDVTRFNFLVVSIGLLNL
ncbi:putative ribonuclease H-like domain-containing protein [Tanacetum coccineum]